MDDLDVKALQKWVDLQTSSIESIHKALTGVLKALQEIDDRIKRLERRIG